jgi:hypothetical protein
VAFGVDFGVAFGVARGVGFGVGFGVGAGVGLGVGRGVGAGVGATIRIGDGETAVRLVDRLPLPFVAENEYDHEPPGSVMTVENVTPVLYVVPAPVIA